MKPLFYTSTRPKHKYKTEKFFSGYLRTKKLSQFVSGSSKQFSNFKKMLVMKKFFMWYYNIKSWRLFFKVFKLSFLQKRYTFRYLLSLYHLLERNLLILLIRTKFSLNLIQSLYYVKNQFVYVNGFPVTLSFSSTKLGDIIEVFTWQYKYLSIYFPILLLTRKSGVFYYQYYTSVKTLYFSMAFYFKNLKKKLTCTLKYKYYYSLVFFKILLFKNYVKTNRYILSKIPDFIKFIKVTKKHFFLKYHNKKLRYFKKSKKFLKKAKYFLFRNYYGRETFIIKKLMFLTKKLNKNQNLFLNIFDGVNWLPVLTNLIKQQQFVKFQNNKITSFFLSQFFSKKPKIKKKGLSYAPNYGAYSKVKPLITPK